MASGPIRVLLIEDEETDYLITRRMLSSSGDHEFDLQWADSWQAGIEAIRRCAHDVCLLDFRVGGGDGLELLKESLDVGCRAPVILLTGINDYRLDVEAMGLGAADYLVKDKLTPELLERSIRYAISQAQSMDELRRRQDDLSASDLRFRSIVQSATDAIILSDESAKILFWNKGAETVFGYTEEEIIGQPIETLMPEPYRARHREGMARYCRTGRSHIIGSTVEMHGLRKDGTVFPLELSLAAWTNGNGSMFTAIIRDATERKRTEDLRRAKEDAEDANRCKTAFLASMSHELRTPLHSIISFTKLLLQNRDGNLTKHDIDFLERILLNANDQLQLINSVLDLSKVEAGRMELRLEQISIDSMIRDVVKQLETERRSPNVDIVLRLPSDARPVRTDSQKLKQVLINLVDNALKFTKQGSVTIELILSPEQEPARIDVTDTGVGMPRERIHEIFEPFIQLTSSGRAAKGSGLGLSICRTLCDLMGYELQVHSEPGSGSTFSILLAERNRLLLTA
jgi:protein-histidine pros-kinase